MIFSLLSPSVRLSTGESLDLRQEGRYAGAMNEVTQKAQQEPDMS